MELRAPFCRGWVAVWVGLAGGCDDKATQSHDEAKAPQRAAALSTAATASAVAPATIAPPSAKAKKQLADCATSGPVEFEVPGYEKEARKKLEKPEGEITFSDLAKIRSFNISQERLTELDPCLFAPMTGLKELFLGPGTYADLGPIAKATGLESLRASANEVVDISPLANMTKLDRLDLGRTRVRDLTPLSRLKLLTELQLDDTPVQDITPLANLENLEILSLKHTQVEDASPLSGLKKLKFVYVGNSPLQDNPAIYTAVKSSRGVKVISE